MEVCQNFANKLYQQSKLHVLNSFCDAENIYQGIKILLKLFDKTSFNLLKDPNKVKKEDLTLSFLRSLAEVQGHLAHVHALAHQVRTVFFVGGFINMELMRRYLSQEINARNLTRPEVDNHIHGTL